MEAKNILASLWIFTLAATEIRGQCNKPTLIGEAVIHPSDTQIEVFTELSAVRLQCNPGYEPRFSRTPRTLTCVKGQWKPTPDQFSCQMVKCGPPPVIPNGHGQATPKEVYRYGEAIQYTCEDGYTLFGDNEPVDTVHCLDNGTWSKEPRCVDVNCNTPHIPNARRVEGGSGPYVYRSTLKYECNGGYKMASGTGRMVCLENVWSSIPKCEEVNCNTPHIPNARRVEGGSGPYVHGSKLKYECNVGYKMTSGTGRMVCLEYGWSSIPTCEEECRTPLGMESGEILDEKVTASSVYTNVRSWHPYYARLKNTGIINAWCPAKSDQRQWLQVDLGRSKRVSGIITQGAKSTGNVMYVSAFIVQYSENTYSWQMLRDPTGSLKTFEGNMDNNTPKVNMFDSPIVARFVRILPWTWHGYIAVRMELLGC